MDDETSKPASDSWQINMRVPPHMQAHIEGLAGFYALNRAAVVRLLIAEALAARGLHTTPPQADKAS